MKNRTLTSALAATALLFPIAAFGQSSSGSAAGTTGTSAPRQQQNQPTASAASGSTMATTHKDKGMASGQIQRVNQEQLDQRVTATDIIGKNVVGRNGDKIGDIKDVGFGQALPQSFHQVTAQHSDNRTGTMARTTSTPGTAGTTAGTTPGSTTGTRAATSPAGTSATASATLPTNASSMMSAGSEKELMVYLSVGGIFGLGEDLVAIPASELRYDVENDHFTMQRNADEVTRIAKGETTGVGAAAE